MPILQMVRVNISFSIRVSIYFQILLHNPHKKINSTNNRLSYAESNYDIATLNFNHEIRAIETGCLEDNDPKEVLVIGSSSQLLGNKELKKKPNQKLISFCIPFSISR